MKNKKTIVNDVDVSGCKCYNPNIKMDCLLYPLQSDFCKNNPNCHYKLYKRKEQECEKLKETLIEIQQDLEFATYCESQECGCDDANECLECTKKQILQKISEVQNADIQP